jgi:transposase-like protein
MSKTTRRRFTAAFKKKVNLEALKERENIEALAKNYDIHPNQINTWKSELISKSETVFVKS